MSILSDSELLINHIKNSFLFGDDTGICESIIEKDWPANFNIQDIINDELNYPIRDTLSLTFRSCSPEIPMSSNNVNTSKLTSEAIMEEVILKDSKIPMNHQVINTEEWPRFLTEQDINNLFSYTNTPKSTETKTSLLSKMLEETNKTDIAPVNLFSQYARFSAVLYTRSVSPKATETILNPLSVCDEDANKSFRDFNIHFWNFEEQRNRSNPVVVRPTLDAKVIDVIGLACWKYVEENRYPALLNVSVVNKLQLYMFEDVEDLEFGFGSLKNSDPIYKYHFSHLALVETQSNERNKHVSVNSIGSFVTRSYIEKMGLQTQSIIEGDSHSISNSSEIGDDLILVEIQLAHGLSKSRFSPDTTVEQIIKHTVNKRHLLQHGDHYKYKLELTSEPGKELDMSLTLAQIESYLFTLVRDMSRRKPAMPDLISENKSSNPTKVTDHMQPQHYSVHLKKPLKRWDSNLSISQDIVEIECQLGKLPFRIKPKTIRIPIEFLANCEINYHGQDSSDSSQKVTIKLLHLKGKSPMARNLKESIDYDLNTIESDSSHFKSSSHQNVSSLAPDVASNNLLSDLTVHCISCQKSTGNIIYDQIMAIINSKRHWIRREYLSLLENNPC